MGIQNVENIADWCREFPAGSNAQSLATRESAILRAADVMDESDFESLVRLAFGLTLPLPQRAETAIRTKFNGFDGSFQLTGNARELQVMAGAIASALVRRKDKFAPIAALSVVTAACGGLRSFELPVNLVSVCSVILLESSKAARLRLDIKKQPPAISVPASKSVEGEFNATNVSTAIKASVESAIASVQQGLRSAFSQSAVLRSISVLEEELQMLWWLTDQWSASADKAFSDVAAASKAMVFAKDLAAITDIFPGIPSMKGLLSRAGVPSANASVVSAVNSLDRGWIDIVLKGIEPSAYITPLHLALQRRKETLDDNAWAQGWSSATGIAVDCTLIELDLGLQFYRESVLLNKQ